MTSFDQKAAFRLNWCKKKLEALEEVQEQAQRYNQRWQTIGKYMSFDAIVKEEGGADNPENVEARCMNPTPLTTTTLSSRAQTHSEPGHALNTWVGTGL